MFSSFGSLSEHQPVQTLQILQLHSIQDCGREYPRISTNSACYNRALCRSGFLLIAHLIVIIPNSLKSTVVFSLQLLRNMLSNSVCSECYCCQTFAQQEQNLITIRPYSCSPGNRQYCKVPTSTSITVNST